MPKVIHFIFLFFLSTYLLVLPTSAAAQNPVETPTPPGQDQEQTPPTITPTPTRLQISDDPPDQIRFIIISDTPIDWDSPPTINIWAGDSCQGALHVENKEFNREGDSRGKYIWNIRDIPVDRPYSAQGFLSNGVSTSCVGRSGIEPPPPSSPRPGSDYCLESAGDYQPENPTNTDSITFTFIPHSSLPINNYRIVVERSSITENLVVDGSDWVGRLSLPRGNHEVKLFVDEDGGECSVATLSVGRAEDFATGLIEFAGTPEGFASRIIIFAIGISGGLAFLLIVFGSFKLIFSAGNPDAVIAGRQSITAAIVGLIVIIFSVFLLRLIGVSILGFGA